MRNYALIDKTTGLIINALSTPDEEVKILKEDVNQEVIGISQEEFDGIFAQVLKYYNYVTKQFEPLIVRCLCLLTPGPYSAGNINLQFEQQDNSGKPVIELVTFEVIVNGVSQEVLVDDGTLEIELECFDPTTVSIRVEAWRYEPTNLEVVIDG